MACTLGVANGQAVFARSGITLLGPLVQGLAGVGQLTQALGGGGPWATRRCLFHFILATVETLTRLPLAAPYLTHPDDPKAQPIIGVSFLLYLAGAALQIGRLRRETRMADQAV